MKKIMVNLRKSSEKALTPEETRLMLIKPFGLSESTANNLLERFLTDTKTATASQKTLPLGSHNSSADKKSKEYYDFISGCLSE